MSELSHATTEFEDSHDLESKIFDLVVRYLQTTTFSHYDWRRLAEIYKDDPHHTEILQQYIDLGTDEGSSKRLEAYTTLATIAGQDTAEYERALAFLDTARTDLTSQIPPQGTLLSLSKDTVMLPEQSPQDDYTPSGLINGYLELERPLEAWESVVTLRGSLGNDYPMYLGRIGRLLCRQNQLAKASQLVEFLKSSIPPSYNPDLIHDDSTNSQFFNAMSYVAVLMQTEIDQAASRTGKYEPITFVHFPFQVKSTITEESMRAHSIETEHQEAVVVELYFNDQYEQALEAIPDSRWSTEPLSSRPTTPWAIAKLSSALSKANHTSDADNIYALAKYHQKGSGDQLATEGALLDLVRAHARAGNVERALALASDLPDGTHQSHSALLFDNIARELLVPNYSRPNTPIVIKPEALGTALDVILANIGNVRSQQKAIENLMYLVSNTKYVKELQILFEIYSETFEETASTDIVFLDQYRCWLMQCAYNAGDLQLAVDTANEIHMNTTTVVLLLDILQIVRQK